MNATLQPLADRASCDPFFLGYWIDQWEAKWNRDPDHPISREVADDTFALMLCCDADKLTKLRLCGLPESEDDCRQVAEHLGIAAHCLLGFWKTIKRCTRCDLMMVGYGAECDECERAKEVQPDPTTW